LGWSSIARATRMRHLPIYLDTQDALVIVSGAGETALAKVRLLLKTTARIQVFGSDPIAPLRALSAAGEIRLFERQLTSSDISGSCLLYAANDDETRDAYATSLGRTAGVLVNVVDNLEASDFITPAMIDRDPLTIAIGTEGTAPVLARQLKAQFEEQLDSRLGTLARVGRHFRAAAASLPRGRPTRAFWTEYYDEVGPRALAEGGEQEVRIALAELLAQHLSIAKNTGSRLSRGQVWLIGAGPGDPELLTNKARRVLHDADVVMYDRLVSKEVLELARREAKFVEVGKAPGRESWRQDDINRLMISYAGNGFCVARLKSGDPAIYGRLDEEMDALDGAGVPFEIVPGVTASIAAAAKLKVSLTKRERNSEFRLLTGQDINGFADHDWRALGRPGAVAAVYMGIRAARFLQGRLLMHGANPATPISIVENISRANEKIVATTLAKLASDMRSAEISGPAIILFGLSPRAARAEAARAEDTRAGSGELRAPKTIEPTSLMGAGS
ncbi:MAG: siroheme synthase CysG, partial [Hyphomicrobiaceae bacterium]